MNGKARWIGIMALTIMLLALAAGAPVAALEVRSGDDIVIESTEVIEDDLYLSAQTITINGVVKGDLIAAAETITVNGVVEGDLLAAGQSIVISGEIGDDARLGAAVITLKSSGRIADDLVAAGYSLETEPGSRVGGTLLFAGSQALLAGSVQENVKVAAGSLALYGQVGGDVDADVGGADSQSFNYMAFVPNMPPTPEIPGGLTVQGAEVGGQLTYTSPDQVTIPDSISAQYVSPETKAAPSRSFLSYILGGLRSFVALLLVGLLMVGLASGFTNDLVKRFGRRWWQSLVVGLIALFGAIAVLLIFTLMILLLTILLAKLTLGSLAFIAAIVGMLLVAVVIVVLLIIGAWISRVVMAVWLGEWILRRIRPQLAENRFVPLILGLLIIVIVLSIPIVGGIVGFVITLAGLGVISLWALQRHDERLIQSARNDISG